MGKKLIIMGADFSANGVSSKQVLKTYPQTALSVTTEAAGWINTYNTSTARSCASLEGANIPIPAGATLILSGLKGISGTETALWVDYCIYSSSSINLATSAKSSPAPNFLRSASSFVSGYFFPLNHDGVDSLAITNQDGVDRWICFAFRLPNNGTLNISKYRFYVDYA